MTKMTRRTFLSTTASAGLISSLPQVAIANTNILNNINHTLVCIFLRGGADGLHMVAPYGDRYYANKRGNLALNPPSQSNDSLIDLDGFFGLNPLLTPLDSIFQTNDLAIVHATGLNNDSHSHFDAQALMEAGVTQKNKINTGWLGRYLNSNQSQNSSVFKGVSKSSRLQTALKGESQVSVLNDTDNYGIKLSGKNKNRFETTFASLYSSSSWLGLQGQLALDSIKQLNTSNLNQYSIENNAIYPQSSFGKDMMQIAQLIKSEIPMEAACVDINGWDMHTNLSSRMKIALPDLAKGLAAFYQDLGEKMQKVTVVVMTEFGRRIQPNGSGGLDHGHGSALFVLGKNINGGRVYGDWPGLDQLYGPGDLAISTDYRTVLSEILVKRMSNAALETVFPKFSIPDFLGIC